MTAGMALRLAAWLGTSPELWLGMQTQFDLWQAERILSSLGRRASAGGRGGCRGCSGAGGRCQPGAGRFGR
ncbi:hypothetical protein [Thauera aromatica]|uniref:hypothetical protein n=1 Tax=Thauera aromatica TaxID=59405 RepID=UPI003CD0CFBC